MALDTMPFGKHKGERFSELEGHYIEWLLEQDYLRDELRERLTEELEGRGGVEPVRTQEAKRSGTRPSQAAPEELAPYIEAIVTEGYRAVAPSYLPGTPELRLLNRAGFYLREKLGIPGR